MKDNVALAIQDATIAANRYWPTFTIRILKEHKKAPKYSSPTSKDLKSYIATLEKVLVAVHSVLFIVPWLAYDTMLQFIAIIASKSIFVLDIVYNDFKLFFTRLIDMKHPTETLLFLCGFFVECIFLHFEHFDRELSSGVSFGLFL